MIFTTYWFLAFTLIFLLVINLLPNRGTRQIFLIVSCLIFHGHFAGPAGVLPIVFLGLITFFAPLIPNSDTKKVTIVVGISICATSLLWYKYTALFLNTISPMFPPDYESKISSLAKFYTEKVPPLAISFFVFEFCHYLIEVYRGKQPIRKVSEFVLFSIFFPTLVAGPIKRYQEFLQELRNSTLSISQYGFFEGFFRVLTGFGKKVFVADTATQIIGDMYGSGNLTNWTPFTTVVFILLLYVRIYMDFSGYSDIAIGLAKIMGIRIPENFNYPFIATNLSDFWNRWHISLSSWIRDYVYIPLGGGRSSFGRKLLNAGLAMFICGLWHGSAWNFVLWGILHGVGLFVQNVYSKYIPRPIYRTINSFPLANRMITFVFVSLSWVIFFYSPGETIAIFKRLSQS